MNTALPVAKQMLTQYREFYPLGGTMSPSGEIAHVSGWTGKEPSPSSELIELLNGTFRDGAAASKYRATIGLAPARPRAFRPSRAAKLPNKVCGGRGAPLALRASSGLRR